jgi:hypothetical protein
MVCISWQKQGWSCHQSEHCKEKRRNKGELWKWCAFISKSKGGLTIRVSIAKKSVEIKEDSGNGVRLLARVVLPSK